MEKKRSMNKDIPISHEAIVILLILRKTRPVKPIAIDNPSGYIINEKHLYNKTIIFLI